ncbi:MAG: T9SS type A sorting domain-containing protein [Ferruginibacter sp.]
MLLLLMFTFSTTTSAQQILIQQRSNLVMKGNVHLVVHNAAFTNNGTFVAAQSTVKFTGNSDTTAAHIAGTAVSNFNNLSVSKYNNGIALKSAVSVANTLTVDGGKLYTDSNLTLKSTESITARVAPVPTGSDIIGKTMVERYVPSRRAWRLATAPVTASNSIFNAWQNGGVYEPNKGTLVTAPGATGAAGNGLDVSPLNNISMRRWSAALQNFDNVTNTHVAISTGNTGRADNTGYFIFVRGDRDPVNFSAVNTNNTTLTSTGQLQIGAQTFNAATTAGGYTLIGNPYASPIDFNLTSKTNLVNRFYVWDPKINVLGGYVMIDDLDNNGVFIKSVIPSDQNQEIQSGQAFFVQTNSAGAASITINESNKTTNNINTTGFRPTSPNTPATATSGFMFVNLYLPNTDGTRLLGDGIFAEFNANYKDAVLLEDAVKFTNTNENLGLLRYGTTLAAERRPALNQQDTLYLRIWKLTARNYSFEFLPENLNAPGMQAFLEDSYLNTSTPLSLTTSSVINFDVTSVAASYAIGRFKIVFKTIATVLPVTITSVKAFELNKDIAVEWTVENEINMLKYDVETSTNGSVFTFAGTVQVQGNQQAFNSYRWVDVQPLAGIHYYRIKTYDRSGKINYSTIVKVQLGKATSGMVVYPNPVQNNSIHVMMQQPTAGKYAVQLTNAIGQVLYNKTIQVTAGSSTYTIEPATHLVSGMYQLEIVSEMGVKQVLQVVVE